MIVETTVWLYRFFNDQTLVSLNDFTITIEDEKKCLTSCFSIAFISRNGSIFLSERVFFWRERESERDMERDGERERWREREMERDGERE